MVFLGIYHIDTNDHIGGKPYFPQKGGTGFLLEEKGCTSPLFDTASPPFAEKRSSRQISNTDRKYRPPNKSDTGKIPIPKKLLVTPWYTTLVLSYGIIFEFWGQPPSPSMYSYVCRMCYMESHVKCCVQQESPHKIAWQNTPYIKVPYEFRV